MKYFQERPCLSDCGRVANPSPLFASPKFLIAVGGGSVIETAKALSLLDVNDGLARECFFEGRRAIYTDSLPLIVIIFMRKYLNLPLMLCYAAYCPVTASLTKNQLTRW